MTHLATMTDVQEAPVQAAIRVETVTDYQSFLNLERVWDEVAEAARPEHPFLEFTWVRTWWECFGTGSSLHVLVVRAGERPIAIAPLILTPIRWWGIKARRLGFFYNAHVPSADFLIAERHDEVYRAIWTRLSQDRCWDVLQLCQLPEGCGTLDEMQAMAAESGCRAGLWTSEASPYVPLGSCWNEYFEGLAAKHRSNLRNRFKRLKAEGPLEVETIASTEGLAGGLEDGLRLEAAAWKGAEQTAIACDPAIAKFYTMLAERAAERGWLQLHFLQAGATRVAFDFSLRYSNRIHLLKLGYDPEYSKFSPSNLLLCMVLESAFSQGIEEYDFLGADADWKMCWAKQVKQHFWLFIFAGTLKGRALHYIKFQLVPLLKHPHLRHVRKFLQRAVR